MSRVRAWLGRAYLREMTAEYGHYHEELVVEAFLLCMIGDEDDAYVSLLTATMMNKENPPA